MAKRSHRDNGKSSLVCLQTDIRPVQMKPQGGLEMQARIAPHDQQQLVECCDPGGQRGALAKQSAAIDDPADAFGVRRLRRISRRTSSANAVHARDTDRPEAFLGLAELLGQAMIPSLGQVDILVDTHDPLVPGAEQSGVQSVGRTGTLRERERFVDTPFTQARRGEKVAR